MYELSRFHLALLMVITLGACSAGKNVTGAKTSSVNVLCYNIHVANPPSAAKTKKDIPAISKVISDAKPDVVLLQEVDVHTARSGKEVHQAEALAKLNNMAYFFAKGIDYDGGEYGIAILTHYPILETKRYPLTTVAGTNGEPRVLATALLQLPGNKRLLVACTHLDAQRGDTNRLVQIREVTAILKDQPYPIILAGDLNAPEGSAVINILDQYFTRSCKNCAFTIPEKNPTRCIDFISFSPGKFEVEKHQVIQEPYASDHLPVNAVLRLK